ncbi:MAG: 16S rRNA (cytosine(1402)-N(4))-methyltransferase RsmH [Candidatus Calescibacterium sp.]|nr:16S rRNA (cytosine(1402)-N(4))-methyltransferase RsmH [Candidatus Calescibacterium sp.]MDW8132284.1 16S rRNA (cytosine(1402)-N(4))-methyltransferase RsmH [Candidatus Calescibacterium sp.]
MDSVEYHFPVLVREIVEVIRDELESLDEIVFVDCTLGLGGHSSEIIPCLSKNSSIFLLDRDKESIEIALKRIGSLLKDRENVKVLNISFSRFFENLELNGKMLVVLADLGISYYQIKNQSGFSFNRDTFLDMRYDKNQSVTAFDIINTFNFQELYDIFYRVFENKKLVNKIVSVIVVDRERNEIRTTYDLNKSISKVVSFKFLKDILQKVYLALRIFVNRELEELTDLLNFFKNYKQNFLLLIISYHSLEGKIIKDFIKTSGLTFKKIKPSKDEISRNKPSRSAVLWVIKK